MWLNTLGLKVPRVSEFTQIVMIARSTTRVCSSKSVHSSLFFFTLYEGDLVYLKALVVLSGLSCTNFISDSMVAEIGLKNENPRLLARVLTVSTAAFKHAVILFKRIWVVLGREGILVGLMCGFSNTMGQGFYGL